ncbi:MAG: hypothetical protein JWO82_788 [Akkermansiaceae bacterium]|nr:hypothetical protein [Akkermansiaceae bacterium]
MNHRRGWKSWTAGLAATACLTAGVLAADFTTQTWRVAEIPLTSAVTYADPFQNVDVTATFTGPGGRTIVRPAFWDGGTTWRVRFAPTAVGEWSMTTTCTDPSNTGLQGISRTVQCDAYTGTLPIFQHGFVKTSADGHYFTYDDGTPFFYLGDTHWIYSHERFSTSNIPGVASEFKYTVDKRVEQGFTDYQSEAIHIPLGAGAHDDPSEEKHADLRDGLTEADLPGFANLDRKFAYLADSGLVHANSEVTWVGEPGVNAIYTPAYMTRLGRYWAARFAAYPVFWTVAQEVDPNVYGAYDAATIGLWFAAAKAVSDNDAYGQPLGAHMQSISNGMNHPSDSWFGPKPYHKWWPMQIQYDTPANRWVSSAQEFYYNTPTKPLVLYESPYDTFWTDNKGARSSGYRAFQTGLYGYGYGANGTWSDLYQKGDYGTDYFMPAGYLQWYAGANLPTGDQMTYLKAFYTAQSWWKLIPRYNDAAWSSSADPDHSLVSSDGNSTYVAYFFGTGTGTGTLRGMAAGTAYDAFWYDPRTGTYAALGGISPGASGEWSIPVRPTNDDWVLLAKQNPAALVVSPANGATLSASAGAPGSAGAPWTQLSWSSSAAPAGQTYEVWFGTAARYDFNQPHGNLARLTPQGGTTGNSAGLPTSLPPGAYYWVLTATDPATGVARSYTSSFTFSGSGIAVANGSFETPGALSGADGWAHLDAAWTPAVNSEYQQNNLAPAANAHFTATPAGGGFWYTLINGNTGSLRRDLQTSVKAGDTLSVTFYGGRAQASASTAAGGVFTATLMVGSTPYSLQVDTTTQANNTWKAYTLTKTVTNAGPLSLVFTAVSGDPWLDSVSSVSVATTPVLFVGMKGPVDGGQILTGSAASASATVTNATGAVTVSYDLTGPDGVTTNAGSSTTAPDYSVDLGTLAPGAWQIRATATAGAEPPATATSLTQSFQVGPVLTVPVRNPSFETPGSISAAEGWGRIAAVWNPAVANDYQQDTLVTLGSAHFSAGSPGGGVWEALINANTGSIHQDLNTTVKAGDTVSVTFYGGRGRVELPTPAGGVFNASFLVGSTRYSMPVDTTLLANDSWQSYTLTRTVTNAGPLSLEFAAVSGDPWLDNISNVTVIPATAYSNWSSGTAGVPAGQAGFTADANNDGVSNGIQWLLGGSSPLADGLALLPTRTVNADGSLSFSFNCLNPAVWGTASLDLQYSNDLSNWTSSTVPSTGGTVNGVTYTISGTGPLHVTATLPKAAATDVRLFGRVRGSMP